MVGDVVQSRPCRDDRTDWRVSFISRCSLPALRALWLVASGLRPFWWKEWVMLAVSLHTSVWTKAACRTLPQSRFPPGKALHGQMVIRMGGDEWMKLSASAALLLLAFALPRQAAAAPQHDVEVLSACTSAVFEEAFSQHAGRRDRKVAHVLPQGETSRDAPARAYFTRQLASAEREEIGPVLGNLQARVGMGWDPPSGISIPGVRVRLKKPRKHEFLGYRDFFLSFWPPGYDPADKVALVVATFGPTPHGAEAACHLRRQGDTWVVEQNWVVSWL